MLVVNFVSFNRTIVELKFGFSNDFDIDNICFNRTIVELKY